MKPVSFLRSWRRRGTSKSCKDDDSHLPLQNPLDLSKAHSQSPSPSDFRTSPRPTKPPVLSLTSPFRETFSHSVEEALSHRELPQPRYSPNRRGSPPRPKRENDDLYLTNPPSQPHRPQQYAHQPQHRPTLSAGPTDVANQLGPRETASPRHLQVRIPETGHRNPSPTHDKHAGSLNVVGTSAQPAVAQMPSRARHTEGRLDASPASVSPTKRPETHYGNDLPPHQRLSVHSKEKGDHLTARSACVEQADLVDARARRGLTTTRSTPHLRPETQYSYHNDNPLPPLPPLPVEALPSPSDPRFASLFPPPPPLVIRKKRPQPLVLHPQATAPSSAPCPSPNLSSADSTPVATPQSTRTQFSVTNSSSAKPTLGRKASVIPPPVHSPPTSPLPLPPTMPPRPRHDPPPPPLKTSRSAINLRVERAPPSGSTHHRMTSSDPISKVAGQPERVQTSSPLKLDPTRHRDPSRHLNKREGSRNGPPPEGSVQWGYAL